MLLEPPAGVTQVSSRRDPFVLLNVEEIEQADEGTSDDEGSPDSSHRACFYSKSLVSAQCDGSKEEGKIV